LGKAEWPLLQRGGSCIAERHRSTRLHARKDDARTLPRKTRQQRGSIKLIADRQRASDDRTIAFKQLDRKTRRQLVGRIGISRGGIGADLLHVATEDGLLLGDFSCFSHARSGSRHSERDLGE